jgi:hypothetical protein
LACFDSEEEQAKVRKINLFLDEDFVDVSRIKKIPRLSECAKHSNIIELVRKLAHKYRSLSWDGSLPVPENLVTVTPDDHPIEIRRVPLVANHGAVWRMDDGWVIYLNSTDPLPRQRFTLYHEVFHALAHCHGHTVFKKSENDEVYFNEYIADYFSANVLMPHELVVEKWPQIGDVNKMADVFGVPAPIMCGVLRRKQLL